jgi:hypothetical protein
MNRKVHVRFGGRPLEKYPYGQLAGSLPYFSSTDDESERGTGVYGVIGRITGELPEARFRYSCGGHFRELLAEDLFDDPSTVARTVKRPTYGDYGRYETHGGMS